MITPEKAKSLVDKINGAADELNRRIIEAVFEGVSVTVETRADTDSSDQYFYPHVMVFDPKIDLDWEPPIADEEAV